MSDEAKFGMLPCPFCGCSEIRVSASVHEEVAHCTGCPASNVWSDWDRRAFEPRWIPVSGGLPEIGVEVLVCNDGTVDLALLDGTFDDHARWSLLNGETVTSDVTHWMPLPEAPKP